MDTIYAIQITETLQKTVLVKSENLEKGIEKVKKSYDNGEIVLDYEDFQDVEFYKSSCYKDGVFTGDEKLRECYYHQL